MAMSKRLQEEMNAASVRAARHRRNIRGTGQTQEEEVESYVGPLDLVPGAIFAYSQRAMTADSTASAIRIRRDSDDTEQDFALADNSVDLAAIAAFIGAGDGFVKTYYDQSENDNHATNTTAAQQPGWVANVLNGRPALFGSAGTTSALTGEWGGQSFTGLTAFFVYKSVFNTTETGAVNILELYNDQSATIFCGVEPAPSLNFDVISDDTSNEIGDVTTTDAGYNNVFNLLEYRITTGTKEVRVNGVLQPLTGEFGNGNFGPCTDMKYLGYNVLFDEATGISLYRVEDLVYSEAKSAGECASIRQNIAAYYGITLP